MSRIAVWSFPVTLACAGLFGAVLLTGTLVEVPPSASIGGRFLHLLLADASVRTSLAVSAVGLTLTAFFFFRKPRGRPVRFTRTLDV